MQVYKLFYMVKITLAMEKNETKPKHANSA